MKVVKSGERGVDSARVRVVCGVEILTSTPAGLRALLTLLTVNMLTPPCPVLSLRTPLD